MSKKEIASSSYSPLSISESTVSIMESSNSMASARSSFVATTYPFVRFVAGTVNLSVASEDAM